MSCTRCYWSESEQATHTLSAILQATYEFSGVLLRSHFCSCSSCCCSSHMSDFGGDGHSKNMAFSTVYMRATVRKACQSPCRTIFPASQFRGDVASASLSSAKTARQALTKPHAGDHSFCKMSKHTWPVRK